MNASNALRRLHIGAGFVAGSGIAWVLSEIVTTAPLTFYFASLVIMIVGVMALIDAWRLR